MKRTPNLSKLYLSFTLSILVLGSILAQPCAAQSVAGDPPLATKVTQDEKEAARFLTMATFGPTKRSIRDVVTKGREAWLDEQLAMRPRLHSTFTIAGDRLIEATTERVISQLISDDPSEQEENDLYDSIFEVYGDLQIALRRFAWWQRALTAPDEVHQRVAFALSEIFVVSDTVDVLFDDFHALAYYYDILARGAAGNFRDMLLEVTLSPAMGHYLSHFNNQRSDPSLGRFPDENYAREVMQLFAIGLFELQPNGERRLDNNGLPIPTYSNAEITEFAKIFTGLGDGGPEGTFGTEDADFAYPMKMYEQFHEPGEKRLLNGFVVRGGQTGMKDIEDAVDHLFQHPNVGPFIGRLLIQRLVTSNPSPAYIARVSAAFADNGQGVRGDMKAVVRAILLDPEALAPASPERDAFGHLQEPILRYVSLLRALDARSARNYYLDFSERIPELLRQLPMSSPSVFNFFSPNHQPIGALANRGLVGPEFQITTSSSIITAANLLDEVLAGEVMQIPELSIICLMRPARCHSLVRCGLDFECRERQEEIVFEQSEDDGLFGFEVDFQLAQELQLAENNVPALVDRLDLLLGQGQMSDASKRIIRDAAGTLADPEDRLRLAIYLTYLSPDVAVAN